jgi:predicted DNA-binding protein (MmcQ/YjbR family)
MDVEGARAFLLSLRHVVETQQWGDNLVFWVGDKAIGGKMFALIDLSDGRHGTIMYPAGADRFHELLERDGLRPAPYMARIFWVAADSWAVWRNAEWHQELSHAHAITLAKLSRRTLDMLAMPAREQKKIIVERRKIAEHKKLLAESKRLHAERNRTKRT